MLVPLFPQRTGTLEIGSAELSVGGRQRILSRTLTVEVKPLIPTGKWAWFCLDNVPYHGRTLTILYDRNGSKYKRGKGLRILVDNVEIASRANLGRLRGKLR